MSENRSKLNIIGILTESASFYEGNFKYLIGFTIIYIALDAFWIALEIIRDIFRVQPTSLELIAMMGSLLIIMLGVVVLVFIFGPRFMLAIIVKINSAMNNRAMTLEQSYRETKGKYWVTLGYIILVILISELPVFLLAFFNIRSLFLELFIGFLYVTATSALFFLLLPLIALGKGTGDYLGRAVKLIKGNYFCVLFLYGLTVSLLNFIYVIVDVNLWEIPPRIALGIIYILILFFLFPFAQVVMVTVYRKLADYDEHEVSQEMSQEMSQEVSQETIEEYFNTR